jgi:hypothetical protein
MKSRYSGCEKLHRLKKIGATRWWSKHKALSSIVDFCINLNESDLESSKLVNLFCVLLDVTKGNCDCKMKFLARTLIS